MHSNGYLKEHLARLKRMGLTLIGLGVFFSLLAYYTPGDESIFWLSKDNKKGVYVLSTFFGFLGFYCLGAIWRKRHFI